MKGEKVTAKSKRTKKIILYSGIAVLIIGASYGAYYLYQRKKQTGRFLGGSNSSGSGTTKPAGFSCTSFEYPLSFGTCHPDVGILQRYLRKMFKADLGNYGKNNDGIDERFGKATKVAAMKHLKKIKFTRKDIAGMKAALKFT